MTTFQRLARRRPAVAPGPGAGPRRTGAASLRLGREAQVRAVQLAEHQVDDDGEGLEVGRLGGDVAILAADGVPVAVAEPLVVVAVAHRPPAQVEGRAVASRAGSPSWRAPEAIRVVSLARRRPHEARPATPPDIRPTIWLPGLDPAGLADPTAVRQRLGLEVVEELDRVDARLAVDRSPRTPASSSRATRTGPTRSSSGSRRGGAARGCRRSRSRPSGGVFGFAGAVGLGFVLVGRLRPVFAPVLVRRRASAAGRARLLAGLA